MVLLDVSLGDVCIVGGGAFPSAFHVYLAIFERLAILFWGGVWPVIVKGNSVACLIIGGAN